MRTALLLLAAWPALAQLDGEKERAFGRHFASEIRRQSKPVEEPDVVAYVTRVAKELAAALPSPPAEFTVEVIQGSEHKEPVVFRPGYVFVPVAFVAGVEDEAEFIRTLAHMIGHLAVPPPVRPKPANTASIPLIVMGHPQPHGVLVPESMRKQHEETEREADRIGAELVLHARRASDEFGRAKAAASQSKPRRVPSLKSRR